MRMCKVTVFKHMSIYVFGNVYVDVLDFSLIFREYKQCDQTMSTMVDVKVRHRV